MSYQYYWVKLNAFSKYNGLFIEAFREESVKSSKPSVNDKELLNFKDL